jgi:folylpolyglutamate synthase/dihydropteroate synthase
MVAHALTSSGWSPPPCASGAPRRTFRLTDACHARPSTALDQWERGRRLRRLAGCRWSHIFEATTAAGSLFREARADVAVVESDSADVDATNIVSPLVTAIPGVDHRAQLGRRPLPARRQAMIARRAGGRWAAPADARSVVRRGARAAAPVVDALADTRAHARSRTLSGHPHRQLRRYGPVRPALRGRQVDNAVVAVRLLEPLRRVA